MFFVFWVKKAGQMPLLGFFRITLFCPKVNRWHGLDLDCCNSDKNLLHICILVMFVHMTPTDFISIQQARGMCIVQVAIWCQQILFSPRWKVGDLQEGRFSKMQTQPVISTRPLLEFHNKLENTFITQGYITVTFSLCQLSCVQNIDIIILSLQLPVSFSKLLF